MTRLLFGIPELDRMLDLKHERFYKPAVEDEDKLASIVLLGPDGTGKSVLALHLISRYYADTRDSEKPPKILYISTDLRYEKASRIWNNFALDIPYERDIPCERASDRWKRECNRSRKGKIKDFKLKKLLPADGGDVAEFLGSGKSEEPGFIDLASSSAGDDWGYMIRALSLLEGEGHLVVIDSVAGFETLVGETDAYGEKSTRRARIAHVMRAAQDRCHIVFVVEEPVEGSHLPEEFVADTVIRLRRRIVGGSMRRTLEIEKVRGRAHAGGEHAYSILDGRGSSTGVWENPDEPRSNNQPARDTNYVQIYYSLQYRNQRIKARPGPGPLYSEGKLAAFGIPHLDDMLAEQENEKGLRCGKTCSLIGDAGTGKSALAYSFLCEGFSYYAEHLVSLTEAIKARNFHDQKLTAVVGRIVNWVSTDQVNSSGCREVTDGAGLVALAKNFDETARRRIERLVLDGASKVLDVKEEQLHFSQKWVEDRSLDDTFTPDTPLRRIQYPWKWFARTPSKPIEIADWLLRHPACASPAVLIATGDVNADGLAKRFVPWLQPAMKSAQGYQQSSADEYEKKLFNYVAQHIVCRQLETGDATGPTLFHIIEWAILEAQRLLFGPVLPNKAGHRAKQSGRIRVVIDDFRILRDMYPAVRDDPLFLPFLTFYLGRDGVTSLIVDTDSGRPDKDPSDETNRELRSLVTHQLYTWEVAFFGQRRVAIASVTPLSPGHKGVIREVKLQNELAGDANARPEVDPHFEMYSGLEEGRPMAVPLEVRLYAETAAFQEYVRRENLFFRQVFPSVGVSGSGSDIVIGTSTSDYEALRDFCHMPTDLRLDHSLVFQVDGFWSLSREGSLENQYRYLTGRTTEDGSPVSMEDPFNLFQPIEKSRSKRRIDYFQNRFYDSGFGLTDKGVAAPKPDPKKKNIQSKIERIPFTWDFGFLLCKIDPWKLAATKPLKTLVESVAEQGFNKSPAEEYERRKKIIAEEDFTVGNVWNALPKTNDRPDASSRPERRTSISLMKHRDKGAESVPIDSWRAFLEAARVVADTAADRLGHPVQPFDFAAMSGDSVSCVVLEIWFSEIWFSEKQSKNVRAHNPIPKEVYEKEYTEPGPKNHGLVGLLSEGDQSVYETFNLIKLAWKNWTEAGSPKDQIPNLHKSGTVFDSGEQKQRSPLRGYSLELYMTWLLLLEVLDFASFDHPDDPFDFRVDRTPVQEAVAARHWYKTACVAARNGEKTGHPSELMVTVRLPGHFSARGDWFLATAKGSRSGRLAERALDVLSSRRANILRLQAGLGLPTRDVLQESQVGQLRTGLRGPSADGIIDNVKYDTLFKALGATHVDDQAPEIVSKDFLWLWRSGLKDYDRHSRPWRKWLNRLFLWTQHYHHKHRSGWIGGFKPYDQVRSGDYSGVIAFDSFLEFAQMCDLLISELKAAALQRD